MPPSPPRPRIPAGAARARTVRPRTPAGSARRPLPRAHPARLPDLLLADGARPLRFACTGGLAGLTQLTLLAILTRHGWEALPANLLAFLLAAQLNFALSTLFTWRDRPRARSLPRRWLAFHAAISGMALLNMLVFAVVRAALPDLAASAAGIAAAALGNFLLGDRLVFRPIPSARAIGVDTAREPAA